MKNSISKQKKALLTRKSSHQQEANAVTKTIDIAGAKIKALQQEKTSIQNNINTDNAESINKLFEQTAKELKAISKKIKTAEDKQFLKSIELYELQQQAHNNLQYLLSDIEYKAAFIITLSAIKILVRGRQFINKEGKICFTPQNNTADSIRRKQNTTIEVDDCISETYTVLKMYINAGAADIKIKKTEYGDTPIIDSTPEIISDVYNATQNYLNRQAQKHYTHGFTPQYDDEGNEIGDTMYTAELRAYNLSINNIETQEEIKALFKLFNDREKEILSLMLDGKTELRQKNGSRRNGEKRFQYVDKNYTIQDIANYTGLTIKQVEKSIIKIRKACHDKLEVEQPNTATYETWKKTMLEYKAMAKTICNSCNKDCKKAGCTYAKYNFQKEGK